MGFKYGDGRHLWFGQRRRSDPAATGDTDDNGEMIADAATAVTVFTSRAWQQLPKPRPTEISGFHVLDILTSSYAWFANRRARSRYCSW